jgi:hypothetical protein
MITVARCNPHERFALTPAGEAALAAAELEQRARGDRALPFGAGILDLIAYDVAPEQIERVLLRAALDGVQPIEIFVEMIDAMLARKAVKR